MSFRFQRRYTGPIRAVISDLAGTTVDYGSCAPAGAFVELFKRNSVQATDAQAREPMGLQKRDHIKTMLEMSELAAQWERAHGATATEADIDRLYADFIPLQVACLPNYGDVIPGVPECVALLRAQGVKVAATTGYNREMLEVVLASAKVGGFVPDAAFCAQDVAGGRPAPWMNHRAMEALGVYPAETSVIIGDTIPDIEAALNAGAWSVGVTQTGNMIGLSRAETEALPETKLELRLEKASAAMYAAGAHYVVRSFTALPEVIDDINSRLIEGQKP